MIGVSKFAPHTHTTGPTVYKVVMVVEVKKEYRIGTGWPNNLTDIVRLIIIIIMDCLIRVCMLCINIPMVPTSTYMHCHKWELYCLRVFPCSIV
jgi:hypothetical protein